MVTVLQDTFGWPMQNQISKEKKSNANTNTNTSLSIRLLGVKSPPALLRPRPITRVVRALGHEVSDAILLRASRHQLAQHRLLFRRAVQLRRRGLEVAATVADRKQQHACRGAIRLLVVAGNQKFLLNLSPPVDVFVQ